VLLPVNVPAAFCVAVATVVPSYLMGTVPEPENPTPDTVTEVYTGPELVLNDIDAVIAYVADPACVPSDADMVALPVT
jgi:hypothetical protein